MAYDWSFARRPFWLFSHVFAVSVVVLFVFLGLWQLSRHNDRAALNDVIESRSVPPAATVAEALELPADDVDYLLVETTATFVDADLVRVANRTQGGVAGEHVVALASLDDGRRLLVNRGFVPLGFETGLADVAAGPVPLRGWLRASVERGWFGPTDTGEGEVVPRLDVDAIAARLDGSAPVAPFWLQLSEATDAADTGDFPVPVPLPPLTSGPHLSYMGQWLIFAVLGVGFYGALLWRNARGTATPEYVDG